MTVPSLEVTDEEVDAQLLRLRDNEGELVAAGRPAVDGDHLTIDIHGTAAGREVAGADDFLYEVGSGSIVPELDEQLRGATPGAVLAFVATPPDQPEISFKVLVKDVQRKELPDATDAWAAESSEFSTLDELRDDIRARLAQGKLAQTQMALRENGLAALVDLVDDDEVPDVLVEEELRQRVHDLSHRLERQRITIDQLLAATGRSSDELMAEVRIEAFRSVKADLALRAVADAQDLSVSDEEFEMEVAAMAARMEIEPAALEAQLDRAGRTAAVRSEQRKIKAMTWLLDHVDLVDDGGSPISRDDLRVDSGAEEADSDDASSDGASSSDDATGSDAVSSDVPAEGDRVTAAARASTTPQSHADETTEEVEQ